MPIGFWSAGPSREEKRAVVGRPHCDRKKARRRKSGK